MEIKGKVHCFFEQSGTFKREFIKLGINAYDYDIQDNFNETDNKIDLFGEIVKAYDGEPSLFDNISKDDLIMAFFPCIYFCENNSLYFIGKHINLSRLSKKEKYDTIIQRSKDRQYFYEIALKMCAVCDMRGLMLIVENPYHSEHYLHLNFPFSPSVIDKNRTLRGDYYTKPTQYFFINCEPTYGLTLALGKVHKKVSSSKPSAMGGVFAPRSGQ